MQQDHKVVVDHKVLKEQQDHKVVVDHKVLKVLVVLQ